MNSGHLFRAFVTGFTLLICLSILQRANRTPSLEYDFAVPERMSISQIATAPESSADLIPPPPVEIQSLPLAAMDNTCFDGLPMDLSYYTGMLSGGRAREYIIRLNFPSSLRISVEPQDPYFDASLVLLKNDRQCVLGRDVAEAGQTETASIDRLESGTYRLLVGGYSEACGPYLLTVLDQPSSIARVSQAAATEGRNGTVVRWKSFGEVDLAHFNLYRVSQDGWQRIAVLRAHGTPADFTDYRFTDRDAGSGYGYQLEAVARDGRVETVPVIS